jgi:hypothetical protein
VIQNVDESVLLREETVCKDHLLVDEMGRTGVYGCDRLLVDPRFWSGIFGVFTICSLKFVVPFGRRKVIRFEWRWKEVWVSQLTRCTCHGQKVGKERPMLERILVGVEFWHELQGHNTPIVT